MKIVFYFSPSNFGKRTKNNIFYFESRNYKFLFDG